MIAVSVLAGWVLVVVVAGALWAMWGILNIVFDAIERWHEGRRR